MPRLRNLDDPNYPFDVIDSAKPITAQLPVAAGLLTVLMVAMSAVEAPLQPQDIYVAEHRKIESPAPDESGLLCSFTSKAKDWISVVAS